MMIGVIKIGVIFIISFFACMKFDYTSNEIIRIDVIFSNSINILGLALAITAIFFTVVDRYKEKSEKRKEIENKCFPVLKEMCENVMGILISVIIMFGASSLEPMLEQVILPDFCGEIQIIVLIFYMGFILILSILLDITKSILSLVQGLFLTEIKPDQKQEEMYTDFIGQCKKLDSKHFKELIEYTKALIIKQELESKKK